MIDRRSGPWAESGLAKLGTRVAGRHSAHLHRVQTLLNEMGVAITPAAEAPRVGMDGTSELSTNASPTKLSHEAVLFRVVLTMLQTDLTQVLADDVVDQNVIDSDGTLATSLSFPLRRARYTIGCDISRFLRSC